MTGLTFEVPGGLKKAFQQMCKRKKEYTNPALSADELELLTAGHCTGSWLALRVDGARPILADSTGRLRSGTGNGAQGTHMELTGAICQHEARV
jgi:hypothetical protein